MDRASDYGSEGWGFNSLRARHHHMGHPAAVQELKTRLAGARAVAVLTGAGISADSGVPTFRGADGLWRTRSEERRVGEECRGRRGAEHEKKNSERGRRRELGELKHAGAAGGTRR